MGNPQDNSLFVSKISTGVLGFDDLFYGGLRLPGTNADRGGICIVIYGDRGISKSDLALQIMYGIDSRIEEFLGSKMQARYFTVNHRESEMKKKYLGLKVLETLNGIKYGNPKDKEESSCLLCQWFPMLKQVCGDLVAFDGEKPCQGVKLEQCNVCKLIRHEIINYNDRSETLHWTVGNVSDSTNLIARLDESQISTDGVFYEDEYSRVLDKGSYQSSALQKFKRIQNEVFKSAQEKRSKAFEYSCVVIEGFTAFDTDELKRLPFDDVISKLRATSAVSVLVFDQRGGELHLDGDIIIQMRKRFDPVLKYMYHELHVEKSDLQQHVYGWQKYKKRRDLSVEIYPSIHSLLLKRFATSNAILRLEQDDMRYPQSLLHRFQFLSAEESGEAKDFAESLIAGILEKKRGQFSVYDENNYRTEVDMVDSSNYDKLYSETVLQQLKDGEHTVAVFLLGKTERQLRKMLDGYGYSAKELRNLHYWEVGLGCIWPEEFVSIVKRYISRWTIMSEKQHLHLIVDDFANINLFPLMERERLFVPALVSVCQNATFASKTYDKRGKFDVQLSMVCTSSLSSHNRIIGQSSGK